MPVHNLFDRSPQAAANKEVFETLCEAREVRIERITSRGQTTPEGEWLSEKTHEWVALLQGEASLEFADEAEGTSLKAGDYLFIPAFTRHRVTMTSKEPPAVWLAIHLAGEPPRIPTGRGA